jgi:carbon starvation protein
MNGLVIVLIGIVALGAGYLLYGRWLAKKWGLDPKAKTPAYTKEDGQDYVPSSKFTVFSHQFSSIAGAGPVTGPILASVFGWVPVLLWLIVGGLFFGAVQDFGALYASVKNEGKSMGMIIEKYIGKTGRKLFMLFCWLLPLSPTWLPEHSLAKEKESPVLQKHMLTLLPLPFPCCLSLLLSSLVSFRKALAK